MAAVANDSAANKDMLDEREGIYFSKTKPYNLTAYQIACCCQLGN